MPLPSIMPDEQISAGSMSAEISEVAGEKAKTPALLVLEQKPEDAAAPEVASRDDEGVALDPEILCPDNASIGHGEDDSKEHDGDSLESSGFEGGSSSDDEGDVDDEKEGEENETASNTAVPDGDSNDDLHALLAYTKRRLEKAPDPVPVPAASKLHAVVDEGKCDDDDDDDEEKEGVRAGRENMGSEASVKASSSEAPDDAVEPAEAAKTELTSSLTAQDGEEMQDKVSSAQASRLDAAEETSARSSCPADMGSSSASDAPTEVVASMPRNRREDNAELYALLNYSKRRLQNPSNIMKKSKTKTKSAQKASSKTLHAESEVTSPKTTATAKKIQESTVQRGEAKPEKQRDGLVRGLVVDLVEEKKDEEEEEVKVVIVPSHDGICQKFDGEVGEQITVQQSEQERSVESNLETSDYEEFSDDSSSQDEFEDLSILDDLEDTSPEDVAALAEAARSYGVALLSVAEVSDAVNNKSTNGASGSDKAGNNKRSSLVGETSDISAKLSGTSAKLSESLTRGLEAASSMSKRNLLSGSIHRGKGARQHAGEPTTPASEEKAAPSAGELSAEEGKPSSSSAADESSISNSMLLNLKHLHESNMRKLQSEEKERAAKQAEKATKEASKPVTASLKTWFVPKKKDNPAHYAPVFVGWDGSKTKLDELENNSEMKKAGASVTATFPETPSGSRRKGGGGNQRAGGGRRLRKAWNSFRLTCAAIDSGGA